MPLRLFYEHLKRKGFKPSYDDSRLTLSVEISKKDLPSLNKHDSVLRDAIKKFNERNPSDQVAFESGAGPHPDSEKTLAYYRIVPRPRRGA
ncbi:MAG: hypothetical protein WC792_05075 [Candidatus Micrarchaeia archaeon]|jgi:hypothetical protein